MLDPMPADFDFYGMGKVERIAPQDALDSLSQNQWLACKISGDKRGAIVLEVFPEAWEDISICEEILNIIASRWSFSQGNLHALDIMIGPPRLLQNQRIQQIMNQKISVQTYLYRFQSHLLKVHVLITEGEKKYDSPYFDTL